MFNNFYVQEEKTEAINSPSVQANELTVEPSFRA